MRKAAACAQAAAPRSTLHGLRHTATRSGMKKVLVIGLGKTGTTIVASVIQKSIVDARLLVEPRTVALLEKLRKFNVPWIVKILYEHWIDRPFLLDGIVRGETGFLPDTAIAIIRDPRDALISGLMYRAYECVLDGASRRQVDEWLGIVREKEANPHQYSVIDLIGHMRRIFDVAYAPDPFFETFLKYTSWVTGNLVRLHVLKYEEFVTGRIAALSASLGIELSDEREVDPSLQRVGRTKRSGAWQKLMLPADVAYHRPRCGAALAKHGYDEWDVFPATLNPVEGSDYIARITDEAFMTRAGKAGGQPTPSPNG